MSAKELLLRVLLELRPMLPGIAAVVAASLLVLPTLLVCCKTAWVNDPRFRGEMRASSPAHGSS